MKTRNFIIIVLALFLIILMMREFRGSSHDPDQKPDTVTIIAYTIDTLEIEIPASIPDPEYIYQDTGSIKWRLQNVDTTAILYAYFSTVFYQDTIISDTNAFVVVRDSISQNLIKHRQIEYKAYSHSKSEITTITKPERLRSKWFYGIGVGGSPNSFGVDVGVLILNKKENAYALSIDPFNRDVKFSMYWKIRLSKRR